MEDKEGPGRKGRILKRDDKVLEKVVLNEFSFDEICDESVIQLDNPRGSIIHSKLHRTTELDECVVEPEKFNSTLTSKTPQRPVLRPINFTKDWEREQLRRKTRGLRPHDDDEFDFEFTDYDRGDRKDNDGVGDEKKENMNQPAAESKNPVPKEDTAAGQAGEPMADTPVGDEATVDESLNFVSKAIKDMGTSQSETSDGEALPESDSVQQPEPLADSPENTPPQETTAEVQPEMHQFIPADTDRRDTEEQASQDVHDPESLPSDQYRQQIEDRVANAEEVAATYEEAKARGYSEGFKHGEEKSELHTRQEARAMFGKVNELIDEFSSLKTTVLDNVQENFYIICQEIAQSLLKREFKISPDAFAAVMRRAITETVESDTFKIKVNPATFDQLASLDDQEITKALIKDESIEAGDFRIESNVNVVDGSIGKLVSSILDQADIELFKDEDKAG